MSSFVDASMRYFDGFASGGRYACGSCSSFCDEFLPLLSTLVNHTKTVRGKQVFCMISRDRGMQYGSFSMTRRK